MRAAELPDRLARLALSRLAEPGSWPVWQAVQTHGAAAVAAALASGRRPGRVSALLAQGAQARAEGFDPERVQQALHDAGGRLLVPGDDEWPADSLLWPAGTPVAA